MSNEVKRDYTAAELDKMSNAELAALGTELDDVTVAYRKERWPIEDDPQEKRAAAGVMIWLAISVIAALGFLGVYLFWPWQPKFHGDEGLWVYSAYTPLLGLTSGLSFISLGVAIVQYVKKFIPEEISVQRRHDGRSSELDRRTTTALLNDAWETSTFGRRKAMQGLLGGAGILAGLMIIAPMGGMIKNPWKPRHTMDYMGDGTLWTQGWSMLRGREGELKLYLGRDTGAIAEPHENELGIKHYTTKGVSRLVRMRPEDLAAASMETIFPLLPEDVNDGPDYDPNKDVYENHMHSLHGPRNPVMLIRLRSADAKRAVEREGQEEFHYGDYYAYSKICTHIGCPTSLYEAQTNRILCPCHQSQFDALAYGRPVFGPAARALPQLPISVDEEGYLIATSDFIEPVGPAFWERKS